MRPVKEWFKTIWKGVVLYLTSLYFINQIDVPTVPSMLWVAVSWFFIKKHMEGCWDDILRAEEVLNNANQKKD